MNPLQKPADSLKNKITPLKCLIFDCDGILTDGKLYWAGEEVGFNRSFHSRDGYGLKTMQRLGFKVGVISGGDSLGLNKRLENLGVDFSRLGTEDKREGFKSVLQEYNLSPEQVAYIGDDLFDLPILNAVGLSATVADAPYELLQACDYITSVKGGMGAAREFCDLVRLGQGLSLDLPELTF